jgi:Ran GTPase-activating protein (RanGAP) involved in mRNA processing and transport
MLFQIHLFMKPTYHLSQRCTAYILLISLLLQSCNASFSSPIEPVAVKQEQPGISIDQVNEKLLEDKKALVTSKELIALKIVLTSKQLEAAAIFSPFGLQGGREGEAKQKEIVTKITLGYFDRIPLDIIKIIFSYVGSKGMNRVRQLSKSFYQYTTGYSRPGIIGVEHKSQGSIHTGRLAINKRVVDFRVVKGIKPKTIPSFAWYHLLGEAKNTPQSFWPYIQNTQVHTLNLSRNQIGDVEVAGLAEHLISTQIKKLNLIENQIGDAGACELAKYLPGTQVKTLYLSWNQIGDTGACEIAKHLPGTQIKTLHLIENQISDAGACEIAKYLSGTQVDTLDLTENQIGALGARELAKCLPDTQVKTLYLSGNQIGDTGACELAKHLPGTQIKALHLSYNQITDAGACELAKHLPGTQVDTLDLSYNQISDAGTCEIAKHLISTHIHKLYLIENQIGDAGACELAKYLPGTQVKTLDLGQNQIRASTQQTLKEQYPHIRWVF